MEGRIVMPVVTVVCEERSHEGKRATVGSFEHLSGRWRATLTRSRGVDVNFDKSTHSDLLDANDSPLHMGDQSWPVRERYNLRCELCGFTVPARRERLDPILDRLADAGVSTVSVRALGAILR